MSPARIARFIALGVVAYCVGWLLYPLGIYLWGLLLKTIAWPEYRWGPEGSRIIGRALQPIAYFLIVAALSVILTFSGQRFAVKYSLLVSLGTVSYFSFLLWRAGASLLAVETWALEGLFFVVLLPVLTATLVRVGWLTRRSAETVGGSHAV